MQLTKKISNGLFFFKIFVFIFFPERSDDFTAEEVEVLQNTSLKSDFEALRSNGKTLEAKALLAHFVNLHRIHHHWRSQLFQSMF
jgi:hypothetical protein